MGTLKHQYPHPLEAVFAKLIDGEFVRRRSSAAGHRNIEITVDEKNGATEIRLERDIESDIPKFAKRFINPVNHVLDVIRWRDAGDGKAGTYDVKVSARITVKGEMTLRPSGTGCVYEDTCTPTVDVPLIGKKIAKLVSDETVTAIKEDCRFTQRELDSE